MLLVFTVVACACAWPWRSSLSRYLCFPLKRCPGGISKDQDLLTLDPKAWLLLVNPKDQVSSGQVQGLADGRPAPDPASAAPSCLEIPFLNGASSLGVSVSCMAILLTSSCFIAATCVMVVHGRGCSSLESSGDG